MESFGAKLVPVAWILLFASTLDPISTELKLTAALAALAGIAVVAEGEGVIGGVVAVVLGGGVDGIDEAGSLLLPQALSASAAASAVASIRG